MMSETSEDKQTKKIRVRKKTSRSMLGPVLLIALGIFLLLANLGMLPDLNWGMALRLWPLLLIFIGLNIIVRQVGRPFGTILSFIVALLAVGVFGYVLFFADQTPIFDRLNRLSQGKIERSEISVPLQDVATAEINIHANSQGATITNLVDSNNLLEGEITHRGELILESNVVGSRANVNLETKADQDWFLRLNPIQWFKSIDESIWTIALNPRIPLELLLDLGSGPAFLELEELELINLNVDGASGSTELLLPDGDYGVEYDVGSGSVSATLATSGRQSLNFYGGSGGLKIIVPVEAEVRLVAEDGSGTLHVMDGRFEKVLDQDNEEIWQTPGFEKSPDRAILFVDIGSGSVTISPG